MNVNCLSVEAPFEVFKTFGFQSGRLVDKICRIPDTSLRQWISISSEIHQCIYVLESGAVCGSRYTRHVHLYGDRGAGDER